MASLPPKKYGLIIPQKKKGIPASIKKPSIFESTSSDEEDSASGMGRANNSVLRENKKNARLMESHGSVVKALEQDPSVFEYDSLYDEMQEKKKKADPRLVKKDKTSKYIGYLKKVGERRQLEQDIIYERRVQREMEKDGKDHQDKETFLTSAYRKKLEERKKMEEELRIAARQEEADAVTKQVDMSRFHRNLLDRITEQAPSHESKEEEKEEEVNKERVLEKEGGGRQDKERQDKAGQSGGQDLGQGQAGVLKGEAELEGSGEGDNGSSIPPDSGQTDEGSSSMASTSSEPDTVAPLFPPTVDKEMRRKLAFAKRTNEDNLSSAKDRYLARKRAKLSAPAISND